MLDKLSLPGPESKYQVLEAQPAGFWAGVWHGSIAPFTFLISLFKPGVRVYETHNAGLWYDFGYYFFAGVQGRAVGRNIFLDGNSFRRSPGVDKKRLVADLQAGFSLFWCAAARLDFSVVRRSEEFEGQDGADTIGTASLAFSW